MQIIDLCRMSVRICFTNEHFVQKDEQLAPLDQIDELPAGMVQGIAKLRYHANKGS